jgi:hypothetical protein
LTAIETGNLQTAEIRKVLSDKGGKSGRDPACTATDGAAISREAINLMISASRTSDEQQAAEGCKRIIDLFHDSPVDESIPGKENCNYSVILSAIAPACCKFVAPHATGLGQTLQQLESLARQTSILESLRFDDMLRREDDITEAFGAT